MEKEREMEMEMVSGTVEEEIEELSKLIELKKERDSVNDFLFLSYLFF